MGRAVPVVTALVAAPHGQQLAHANAPPDHHAVLAVGRRQDVFERHCRGHSYLGSLVTLA